MLHKDYSLELDSDEFVQTAAKALNYSPQKVRELVTLNYMYSIVSLNEPVGEEKEFELGEFIPSSEESFEDEVIIGLAREDILEAFETVHLTEREKEILLQRYGFNDNIFHSFEEINEQYGVSWQRIGQIEKKAFAKLRDPRVQELQAFIGKYDYEQPQEEVKPVKKRTRKKR